MSCKCSRPTDEYHGYSCTITDGECMFLIPDSIACALAYGEGPDADKTHEELVKLVEEGKSPMHEFVKKMNEDPEEDDELFEDDGLSDDDDIYLDE